MIKKLQTECLLNKQIQELERELNGISPNSLKRKDLVKKMEKELAPFVERTVINTLKSIDRMLISNESPAEGDYAIVLSHRCITETAAAEIQSDYQNDNEQKSKASNPADKKKERIQTRYQNNRILKINFNFFNAYSSTIQSPAITRSTSPSSR